MLRTDKAIIVEGKYDKIKLSSIIDGVIIQTNGFGLYRDKNKRKLIKLFSEKTGIIILTDSDSAGFQIRNYIKSFVDVSTITNVYIPDIFGKEKRKNKPSKEGKLGVEGIPQELLTKALEKTIYISEDKKDRFLTSSDLYNLGLSGTRSSKKKRKALIKELDLPEHLSTKSFLDVINNCFTSEEFKKALDNISTDEMR